jgi:acyl-CoA dehydrogenase
MDALHVVLASVPDATPLGESASWWDRHRAAARLAASSIDQAILAGFAADRTGYAFASGYQAALRALFPDLPGDRVASLCVTERSGGHPNAIETRLVPLPGGGYELTGKKRWATLAGDTGILFVVASLGRDAAGKNLLRLVRVAGDARGVTHRPMAEPPFTPEIGHDEIDLTAVPVAERDVCPGDGFARYVRPFRTIEDVHVTAAILAYVVREVRLHALPNVHVERLAGLLAALRAVASLDPSAPGTHVALAGLLDLMRAPLDEIDRVWKKTESPAHARWERDRLVLSVAASVREKRRAKAWERLEAGAGAAEPKAAGDET